MGLQFFAVLFFNRFQRFHPVPVHQVFNTDRIGNIVAGEAEFLRCRNYKAFGSFHRDLISALCSSQADLHLLSCGDFNLNISFIQNAHGSSVKVILMFESRSAKQPVEDLNNGPCIQEVFQAAKHIRVGVIRFTDIFILYLMSHENINVS